MIVDLRSDTLTKPTPSMLECMFEATVGDDVFNEDPTVQKLEAKAASIFGKEAGLYCPSGTMTNQLAIKTHTQPMDEVICDKMAHIYNYENGTFAMLSGVSIKLLEGDRGRFTPEQVEAVINPDYDWLPNTRLVMIENTCNKAGGSYYSYAQMEAIRDVCRKHELPYHLDGARIFNALHRLQLKPIDIGHLFDSISVCLSKGLGAPVGSVLLGTKAFIKRARKFRKAIGGGMRQAGYLAAAGIYALDHHVERMKDDHARAEKIGQALQTLAVVDTVNPIDTNIIIFRLKKGLSEADFVAQLEANGILIIPMGEGWLRMVTHLDITEAMVDHTITVLQKMNS